MAPNTKGGGAVTNQGPAIWLKGLSTASGTGRNPAGLAMTLAALAVLSAGVAPVATAETLTFEADDEVIIVRGRDMYGTAAFEFIARAGELYQCIALDEGGEPIAVTTAIAEMGTILFEDLDYRLVDTVKCRRSQF